MRCGIAGFCWRGAGFVVMLLAAGCAAPGERHTYVVPPEDVPELLAREPRLRVIDVRPPGDFVFGHVPGAVSVDPERLKATSFAAETGLDRREYWREEFGRLGINGRDPVLVYDDGRMTEAARLWFMLQLHGAADVKVLNGGYRALAAEIAHERLEPATEPSVPEPTEFDPPADGEPPVRLVERGGVKSAVFDQTAQVFDARSEAEFTGEDLRENTRGGHLPGARHIAHTDLLDERGYLRPPSELRAMLLEAGFEPGQPLITHCDGGGRASLAALAAIEAGFDPVENYYLSYGDWATDATCPVE